jgi:excisionase family DNA binding protein
MTPHQLLTTSEAARELRCSKDTIERRIRDGSLAAVKVGGRWLLSRDVIERVVAAANR